MKYLLSYFAITSLMYLGAFNMPDAAVKKLPKWWDNSVYAVRGESELISGLFNSYSPIDGRLFAYEVILERSSDRKGIVWVRQFIEASKLLSDESVFVTKEVDGFVRLTKNHESTWVEVNPVGQRLYVAEKKLYEIDLKSGRLTNLIDGSTSALSLDVQKVAKVKTYTIGLGANSFQIEDYETKLRIRKKGQLSRQSAILIPEHEFEPLPDYTSNSMESDRVELIAVNLIENKQFEQALDKINEAVELDKRNVSAWVNRGLILQNLNRHEESIAHFDFVKTYDQDDYKNQYRRGYSFYGLGKYQRAKAQFKSSIRKNNQIAYSHALLAFSIRASEKYDLTQCKSFGMAARLDGEHFDEIFEKYCTYDSKVHLDNLVNATKKENVRKKESLLKEALKYLGFHKSLAKEEPGKFNNEVFSVKLMLATSILKKRKNAQEAIDLYKELLVLNNDPKMRSELWYELALSYQLNGQFNRAIEQFQKVVNTNLSGEWKHHERMSLWHLARLYYAETSNYNQALKYINQLLDITIGYNNLVDWYRHPDQVGYFAYYQEGNEGPPENISIFSKENPNQRYSYVSNAGAEGRASVRPLRLRMEIHYALELFDNAIADAQRSMELDSKYRSYSMYLIAMSHYRKMNYKTAITSFEQAKSEGYRESTKGSIDYFMGRSHIESGNLNLGCRMLTRSNELGYENAQSALYDNCYEVKAWTWHMGSGQGSWNTDIYIHKGDIVTVTASGSIQFGVWAGRAGPDGVRNGMFQVYNQVTGSNHGALLCRVGSDGDWILAGRKVVFTSKRDGYFKLMVNDNDPSNNIGEFEGKLNVLAKKY